MSDYLHNLAARTLHLAPVVQPRLPSLFEPLNGAAGAALYPSLAVDRNKISTPPGVVNTRMQHGPLAFEAAGRTPGPNTGDAGSGKDFGSLRNANSRTDEFTVSPAETLIPVAAHIASPEVSTKISQTPGKPVLSGSSERTESDTRVTIGARPGELLRQGTRDVLEVTEKRAGAFRVTRPATRRNGDRFLRQPNEAQASAAETAPTVNVTIGRVDVRAVFPQPQEQRARRAQPAPMSLDEYLKQRSGGRK